MYSLCVHACTGYVAKSVQACSYVYVYVCVLGLKRIVNLLSGYPDINTSPTYSDIIKLVFYINLQPQAQLI